MTIIDDLSFERVKRALPALQEEFTGYQNAALAKAGDQIRDNPVLTLLVAFGLGVIGDFLLRRSLAPAARPVRARARAPRTRRVAR